MSFALDLTMLPGASIRHQANRLSAKVAAGLAKPTAAADGFHAPRRGMKKLRSLLLLGGGTIPEPTLKSVLRGLAALGRQLSGSRDRAVIQETLAEIDAHSTAEPLWPLLSRELATLPSIPAPKPAELSRTIERLRQEIEALPLERLGIDEIALGYGHIYRAGRHTMRRAETDPDDEWMHDWRKMTQRHWRQLQFLRPIWPLAMAAPVALAGELSEKLGRYQDLSVLRAAMHQVGAVLPTAVRDDLLQRCRERQSELRRQSFLQGHLLFAEPAKAVRIRLVSIWRPAEALSANQQPKPSKPK